MDKVGKSTLEIMGTASWYNSFFVDRISKYLSGEILEVGFGTGNFSKILSKYGHVTAIEINDEYLKNISYKNSKISYGFGDIEKDKYFFKSKKFNAIICLNVLEHIRHDQKALKNISSLLKKNGVLILIVPAHEVLYSKLDKFLGHFRRYTKNNLSTKVEKADLKVVSADYFNWLSFFGWLIFIKLLGRTEMPKKEVGIFDKIGKYFIWTENYVSPPFGLSVFLIAKK